MRPNYLLLLLISSLFLITSCGDDEGFTPGPIPSGGLVIVNAIPDSPELSAITNNSLSGALNYTESSIRNSVLPQIPLDFSVRFINSDTQQTLLENSLTIEVGFTQTIVLTGTLANPNQVIMVDPPFEFADGTTDTRIRFLNATSNITNATVNLTNPNGSDATITLPNGQPTEFITTTAGSDVEIVVTDTDTSAVLWTSGTFPLSAAGDRLFILADYFGPGDETVRMFSANDPSGTSLFGNEALDTAMRFSNQVANQGALDYRINGDVLATLNFGEISDYVDVPAGDVTLSITPAGDPTTELTSVVRTIFAGLFYIASGSATETATGSSLFIEDARRVSTQARVNVTKLAPSVDGIDIYFLDPGAAIGGLPGVSGIQDFNTAALNVPAGSFDLVFTETGTTNVLLGPTRIDLELGGIYSFQITDAAGGGEPIQLRLFDDFEG